MEPLLGLAEQAMRFHPGTIIEIGCGTGQTTLPLCRIAANAEYPQRVVGIDPYDKNPEVDPTYNIYPYKDFMRNINEDGHNKTFSLIRLPSTDPDVPLQLRPFFPFSFAFVDGVQTKYNVMYDLQLMNHFEVPRIAVDDYGRLTDVSQVPVAVDEFLKDFPYNKVAVVTYSNRHVVVLDRA